MSYYQRGTYDNRLNTINQQYGLNPYQPQMQQMQPQMQQMQPYQQPQMQPMTPQPQSMNMQQPINTNASSVIPVGGIEEVKAYPTDFSGATTYFTDIANNKIYTKQLELNGASSIKVYKLDKTPSSNLQEDKEGVSTEEYKTLTKRVEEMENKIKYYEKFLGGNKNDESNDANANA